MLGLGLPDGLMSGLGKFIHVDDCTGADPAGTSPSPRLSRCLVSFLVVRRSIRVLDTVSLQVSQSESIDTDRCSCNVRLFDRYIRSQQYHSRLGICHLLSNQREESVLPRHRQLYRCRIIHLDSVHVAFFRRTSLHNGHVFKRCIECRDCNWCVGNEVLAQAREQEDQTI